jgi:hypothetical protein
MGYKIVKVIYYFKNINIHNYSYIVFHFGLSEKGPFQLRDNKNCLVHTSALILRGSYSFFIRIVSFKIVCEPTHFKGGSSW